MNTKFDESAGKSNSFFTNRKRMFSTVTLIITSFLFGQFCGVYAQNSQPRMQALTESSYSISDFENLNLFNGKLNFRMPLLKIGGRSSFITSVNYVIEQQWESTGNQQAGYTMYPSGGGGIQMSLGKITEEIGQYEWQDTNPITCGQGEYEPSVATFSFNFIDSNGMSHLLRSGNGAPISVPYCHWIMPGVNLGREFISWDGDGIKFVADESIYFNGSQKFMRNSSNQILPFAGYLFYPNGTILRIEGSEQEVKWAQDRNGNKTTYYLTYGTININGQNWQQTTQIIIDSLGRETKVVNPENDSTYGTHTKLTYKGFNGSEKVIRATPDKIWMPDGKTYAFFFNEYFELKKVETPYGSKFEYEYIGDSPSITPTYPTYPGGDGPPSPPYRRISERKVYNGTTLEQKTLYSATAPSANEAITQVDTINVTNNNLISRGRHHFHGSPIPVRLAQIDGTNGFVLEQKRWNEGKEFSTEYFAQNGTTVLRKKDIDWQPNGSFTWSSYGTININARVASETSTLGDSNSVSKIEYLYASDSTYNAVTDTKEYDYGQNQVGSFIRRSHTEYISYNNPQNNLYLLYLPSETWISSDTNGNNKVSRIQYEYDNYSNASNDLNHDPLLDRTSITGHSASFGTGFISRGNVTAITSFANAQNQIGQITSYRKYDIAGNPIESIDAKGYVSSLDYTDRFGLPDAEARSNTAPTQLNGLNTYAFGTGSTNPIGYTTYGQFDYFTGSPVDAEDINGNVSSTFYNNDPLDRPTQIIAANNRSQFRRQTTFDYNDNLREITTTSDSKTFNDNLIKTKTLYDSLGRVKETRQYENTADYIVVQQQFDSIGRAYKSTNPFRPYLNETPQWTETKFDSLGRIIEIKTPDNAVTTRSYFGSTATVADQSLKKHSETVDAVGRLLKVNEDPTGVNYETTYTYDVLGRPRKTTQTEGAITQNRYFMYNDLGQLIRTKQPEQIANSNLSTMTDPITGNSAWSISYSYDGNGSLASTTDANNKTITGTYDALNRLILRDYSDSTPDVNFTYDDPNIANSKGQLTTVSTNDSVTQYTAFDELGRVKSNRQITNGQTYDMPNYTYDLSGTLVAQTYPSLRVVTNETDNLGRLSKVQSQIPNQNSRTYLSKLAYTSFGAVSNARLGNGSWESTQFDNKRLQIKQIGLGASINDTSYLKLEYDYGTTVNNGNLLQQKITVQNATNSTVQNYDYDALNRLQSAAEMVSGNPNPAWKQTFAYDRFGNRRFDTSSNNTTTLLQNNGIYNPNIDKTYNRFSTTDGYSYDSQGNLTGNPENQVFIYDARNRQTQVQGPNGTANYYYDGNGLRVRKAVGNEETIFVYDAFGKMVAEYTINQSITNEGTKYMTTDAASTPRVITDNSGHVKSRHDYLPFGEEIYGGVGGRTAAQGYLINGDGIRQQFTGYERDAESGLDYAQARYFSSKHGRFTSIDPLTASLNIKNPQTLNRYSYALNNPYKFTDPSGLRPMQHCFKGICSTYQSDEKSDEDPVVKPVKIVVTVQIPKTAPGEVQGVGMVTLTLPDNVRRELQSIAEYYERTTVAQKANFNNAKKFGQDTSDALRNERRANMTWLGKIWDDLFGGREPAEQVITTEDGQIILPEGWENTSESSNKQNIGGEGKGVSGGVETGNSSSQSASLKNSVAQVANAANNQKMEMAAKSTVGPGNLYAKFNKPGVLPTVFVYRTADGKKGTTTLTRSGYTNLFNNAKDSGIGAANNRR